MYFLSISKEHKEVFQISFCLYCTVTEVKHIIYKKYFNLHYALTSKKANMLTTYHQLK